MWRYALSALAFALLLLPGCKSPTYIEIEETDIEFTRKGQALQLKAKAMDRQGHYYPEVTFEWSVDDEAVATVDIQGRVLAAGSGRTYVYARAKGLESRALVRVNLVEKLEILDKEIELSLEANERFAPRIKIYDYQGAPMDGRQVFLRPQTDGIVQIDGQGGIWPYKIGEVVVVADVEGKSGEIKVTVVE